MIDGCQHAFCLGCMVLKFEGKQDSFNCPKCELTFSPERIQPCNIRQTLIENLVVRCDCGTFFKFSKDLQKHKVDCISKVEGSLMTMNDLLNLDLSDTVTIPKTVERATLKVIQHKMSNSENGTAEFSSGGPRVSKCFCILF